MSPPSGRVCRIEEVQVGDFIELEDYGELYGQVTKIRRLDPKLVGDGRTDWRTFHVVPHDRKWPHNQRGSRIAVGPKRSTDTVVSWS